MSAKSWSFSLLGTGGSGVGTLSDLSAAKGRSFTIRLDDSSEAAFSLDGFSEDAKLVNELSTDLLIKLNGAALLRAVVGPTSDVLESSTYSVSVNCFDYRERLNRRNIFPVDASTDGTTDVDQAALAWLAITRAQNFLNHPGGSMGITQASGNTTGVIRTFPFTNGMKIADDVVSALAHLNNGFEWDITPDLQFKVYYPLRGDQSGQKVLDYGGMVTGLTRSVDPSQYANHVLMTGGEPSFPNWSAALTSTTQATGGYFSEGEVYRYAVSAILPEGETKACPVRAVKIDQAGYTNSIKLAWTACPRATGYNIYGRNMPYGPSGMTRTTATTGGTLRGGKSYRYSVVSVSPDGISQATEANIDVPTGTNTNTVRLTWYRMPGAVSAYRIYGRESGADPQYLATVGQPAAGTDPSWTDLGTSSPLSGLPDPYPLHFLDTVATTSYVDGGVSDPDYSRVAPADNVPGVIQSSVNAVGLEGLPEGIWDMSINDGDITRQTTIEQRAQWQLNRMGQLLPSYTVKINPNLWNSPDDLWVGDRVRLVIEAGRLRVNDSQLRVTEMTFTLSDEDDVSITATVGFKPKNIFEKIFSARSRLDKLGRL